MAFREVTVYNVEFKFLSSMQRPLDGVVNVVAKTGEEAIALARVYCETQLFNGVEWRGLTAVNPLTDSPIYVKE